MPTRILAPAFLQGEPALVRKCSSRAATVIRKKTADSTKVSLMVWDGRPRQRLPRQISKCAFHAVQRMPRAMALFLQAITSHLHWKAMVLPRSGHLTLEGSAIRLNYRPRF